jgi:WD40 repeat protein
MLLLKGHRSAKAIRSLAFAPDGRSLASCSTDRTVRLWDLRTGEGRILADHGYTGSVAFSPDGRTLAWNDWRGLNFFDMAGGQTDQTVLREHVGALGYTPDGKTLVLVGRHVHLWDVAARRLSASWLGSESMGYYPIAALTPDGRTLATGHSRRDNPRDYREHYKHTIKLWDVATARERLSLRGPTQWVTDLAFAPDGRTLAACCGQYLWVWDTRTEEVLVSHKAGIRHFQSVAFSPDGRFLALAHNDQTVRFWDAHTWQERAAFDWTIGPVVEVVFAPDGMRAAAGSSKGKIVVWDVDL